MMSASESTPLLPSTIPPPVSKRRRWFEKGAKKTFILLAVGGTTIFSIWILNQWLFSNRLAVRLNRGPKEKEVFIPFPFERPYEQDFCSTSMGGGCGMPDPARPPNGTEREMLLGKVGSVDCKTLRIVDEDGRERHWRGMNVAYKVSPHVPMVDKFHPVLSFSRSDARLLAKLGMNVIRLGVPWAAVQPNPPVKSPNGQYLPGQEGFDEHYLEAMRGVVRMCAEEGLHVLISAHQDLYTEKFCGNGMPYWTITSDSSTLAFPRPMTGFQVAQYNASSPNGFPIGSTCDGSLRRGGGLDDWGKFYVSDAATRAFWGLYTNDRGIRDDFAQAWKKVAKTLVNEPNILGYELLNEPFIASRTWFPALYRIFFSHAWHTTTESQYLQPLYVSLLNAIREVDRDRLVLYQPVTGNAGGDGFPNGLGEGRGKEVLSYHVYGFNLINRRMGSEKGQILARKAQTKISRSGTMITEFDTEYGLGGWRTRIVERALVRAEEELESWIGWQYKEYIHVTGSPPTGTLLDTKSGSLRLSMAKLFGRPYAEAVAGTLLSQSYNPQSHIFRIVYQPKGKMINETVIRVNEETWGYKNGFEVKLVNSTTIEDMKWRRMSHGRIGVQVPSEAELDGKPVVVEISPKVLL